MANDPNRTDNQYSGPEQGPRGDRDDDRVRGGADEFRGVAEDEDEEFEDMEDLQEDEEDDESL